MFVEHNFFVGLEDIDFNNNLKIKSLLGFLEDIGGIHSNIVGYGLLDIPAKKRSWILINWKVKIFKRPRYAENLKIVTWAYGMEKLYALRDFEIYNESGELVIIATSKWVCLNIEKQSIIKIEPELRDAYTIKNKKVFEGEIEKLKEPKEYIDETPVQITRDMIDVNHHVHNINYIDFATHILPYEVMQQATNIEVMYKKEIKETDKIKCKYAIEDRAHYAVIKSEDDKILHAIIKLS